MTSVGDYPVTVTPHRTLNTVRGVISEDDLLECSEDEILEDSVEGTPTVYGICGDTDFPGRSVLSTGVTHTQSPSFSKGAVPSKEGSTPSKVPEVPSAALAGPSGRTTRSPGGQNNLLRPRAQRSRRTKKWTRAYRSLKTTSLFLKQSLFLWSPLRL
ncbi:hypothetical protein HPB47_025962 [Ixodes persulcatus]|uniref:Uncharacterized protein n=1 Tax=Ixodes persulcatus TaxID=34615 RepID=A0AC60Q0M7_IXOPE|nr:hypothetical protein HPB47_025962 [Ixodes persulcatus]